MAVEDMLGPILEMMTWMGCVLGLLFFLVGWLIKRHRCQWTSTPAEVVEAGNYTGFRWVDNQRESHLTLLPRNATEHLERGAITTVYFDVCHPARWALSQPRHDNPLLILGWILSAVGALSFLGGFLVLFAGA